MKFLAIVLAFVFATVTAVAVSDAGRRKRHRSPAAPKALRGGKLVQLLHNLAANADGLSRIEDRAELSDFIEMGLLVEIRGTKSYRLDAVGAHDRSHAGLYARARPWAKAFLDVELGELHRRFRFRAKVTSLVRTASYQRDLCRSGNRAATCGDASWQRSLHLTGATVDISKVGMSRKALTWMRQRLASLQERRLVHAIEERGAFHVFVRKAYGEGRKEVRPHGAKAR